MTLIDPTIPVREGEALDEARLLAHLTRLHPELQGPMEVSQFPGGASNLTYLLHFPDRELVLRRPPFGHKAKSAHDMKREATVIRALQGVFPWVPKLYDFCEDPDVLGADFYVMERIRGIILRGNEPEDLGFTLQDRTALCHALIDRLVALHQVPWQETELKTLCREGDYVERQINGWCDRYIKARTEDAPAYSRVMDWLKANRPPQVARVLVHNDYRFDNVVLNPDNPMDIIGVLDWEMATIGDPLMDLGNALAYWVEADDPAPFQMMRRQPTHLPGMLTREQVWQTYLERAGLPDTPFAFYQVYGLFRLVVIIQQIYYRYFHGQTRDKRFAGFIHMVKFLEGYLEDLIDKSGQ